MTSPLNARRNNPIEHRKGTTSLSRCRLRSNCHASRTVSTGTGEKASPRKGLVALIVDHDFNLRL